ncbi:acetyl-CoA carboxylase biotin carboxyl carrier protein [Gammaproteobacteria bacterium]|nr:acetyl-CoA carboxylase biotin carboxyl carrier protein [Gammaproteobacteria bacterium]
MPKKLDEIQKLIDMLDQSNLNELEISDKEGSIRLVKANAQTSVVHSPSTSAPPTPAPVQADQPKQVPKPKGIAFKAPMVGTFYLTPSPGADPYVKIGDTINTDQPLCMIEAMKMFNKIMPKQQHQNHKIVSIEVENGQPVQYGQVLFYLEA